MSLMADYPFPSSLQSDLMFFLVDIESYFRDKFQERSIRPFIVGIISTCWPIFAFQSYPATTMMDGDPSRTMQVHRGDAVEREERRYQKRRACARSLSFFPALLESAAVAAAAAVVAKRRRTTTSLPRSPVSHDGSLRLPGPRRACRGTTRHSRTERTVREE